MSICSVSQDWTRRPAIVISPAIMDRTCTTIVRSVGALRAASRAWRVEGRTVALVPTMGALHEGHLSLIRLARSHADKVIASIFVNPAQFAPSEDFDLYPRDEAGDAALVAGVGCDLLYAPPLSAIYPADFATTVTVSGLTDGMEGAARPSHFAGVATVVAKLLIQCEPDVAVFGEKDYQQLQVIRRMAADLDLPTRIVPGPIARAADGLALSSRNAYLTPAERQIAPELHRTLARSVEALRRGGGIAAVESAAGRALIQAGFDAIDYLEVRNADSLARLGPGPVQGRARILAVARLGRTRLLDNLAV